MVTERFQFTVNGDKADVEVERDTPLLYVLRNDLGLKGTRFGCGDGLCGSCIVEIDQRAIFSCNTPVWCVAGKTVLTIEGLARNGELHPLQKGFLDEQAGQCGFCLSGIIMRAKVLLDEKPDPTRAEICAALDRNLCRCGAHTRMIRAIEKVARASREGGRS